MSYHNKRPSGEIRAANKSLSLIITFFLSALLLFLAVGLIHLFYVMLYISSRSVSCLFLELLNEC